MNLPAHGTASPDPSKASVSVKKTAHQNAQNTAFPPGPAHTPPGEIAPDRLAVFTSRQAPAFSQTPLFSRHRLAEHTVPPGASQCRPSHAKAIAWRLSVDRQAPYQNNIFLVYDTPINPVYHLNPFPRSHKNPNLNSHIGEPTIIIYTQIQVPHPEQSHHLRTQSTI